MYNRLIPGSYYGEIMNQKRVSGINFSETLHLPSAVIPKHFHEQPYFCFVLSGAFDEFNEGKQRGCTANSLIYHPQGEIHSDEFGKSMSRCFNIEISRDFNEKIEEYAKFLQEPYFLNIPQVNLHIRKIYKEFTYFDLMSPLAMEGAFFEFLAALFRCNDPKLNACPGWIANVRDYVNERFLEKISIDNLSCLVDIHPVHLVRVFKRYFGCTIADYQRRLRVEFASEKLRDKNLTLAEIAFESGFADQSHFTRTFRLFRGVTPNRFRKMIS